jgi:transcriptional regulator with XRE-family HTH domain
MKTQDPQNPQNSKTADHLECLLEFKTNHPRIYKDLNGWEPWACLAFNVFVLRREKGWSQGELAEKAGEPTEVIAHIESALDEVNTSAKAVQKIAQTLDVSFSRLFLKIDTRGLRPRAEREDEAGKMIQGTMLLEKRAYSRTLVKVPVKYLLVKDDEEFENVQDRRRNEKSAQTADMSLGGMYILAGQKLPAGSILRAHFSLPGISKPLNLYAEVVWANAKGAGLRFLMVKNEDMKILKEFLTKVSS